MDKKVAPSAVPNLAVEDEGMEDTRLTHFSAQAQSGATTIASARETPYFVLVGGSSLKQQVFTLSGRELVMGRSKDASIHLPDEGISRKHARVVVEANEYFIEDLESTNGTFLNGERIAGRYRLAARDRIRLGPSVLLRFEWPSDGDVDESATNHTALRWAIPERWTPTSWQSKRSTHLPNYDNPEELKSVLAELASLPPLVTSWEVERLKALIADAQNGERFLLQGGDCAETIADCRPAIVTNKLKILIQMSLILTYAARKPVIRVGRFAGQYAKPRSKPTEVRDGVELPSYLGDLVNRPEFTAAARRHDPALLLRAYYHASMTLNFIRTLSAGSFSDLRRPEYFDLNVFDRNELPTEIRHEYAKMSDSVSEGLHFLRAMGDRALDELARVEFFASHEGLNLMYEAGQTRSVPRRDGWYCLTTHLPWIGDRTRSIDGAHVEFFRGIANPVGVKIGPTSTPSEVVRLLSVLNPHDEPGKLVVIVRMGAGKVPIHLPPIIEAVKRARRRVLWVTDPMHGNGIVTKSGIKTRDFNAILQEIEETFDTHEACGSRLGGVHFELTGEDVTECIGGGLTEADLDTRYMTACDPRLNYRQAIEMAFLIARRMATSSVRRVSSAPAPSADP